MDHAMIDQAADRQLNVEPYWMPFTPNRHVKADPTPRIITSAKGAYYRTAEGRELFDSLSGLWCCPLGHAQPRIVEALRRQAETLDYCTAFQMSNPVTLRLAERIADMAPGGLDRVFFTNSGSEAVDTALKIALGYHRLRGEAGRFRMIGREKGYHGVGFGGMSVGGMVANRKMFATAMIQGVDHLRHTHDYAEMAFSKGQPAWGAHLADDLERMVALHDAGTIACVIVEPLQGSAGVIVPPLGYLQRLREICDRHGILLIFDEVITGFGRLGAPFGADRLGVIPDMITFAKGITNGIVPMGGVIVRKEIYDTFMTGPAAAVELFHGYTYSGHPLAAAVAHASLDLMEEGDLFARVRELEPILEGAVHTLRDEPGIKDIRNFGLTAAVDLEPTPGQPGARALRIFERGLREGILLRFTGDTIAMGPPFISTPAEITGMIEMLRGLIRAEA
ncbi:Beta-alanine--pyruvate aminotransferase [Methylobacterium bullatum]|uniref:Beta-alanine--pyruvate aminotransferase n=1 Tax=Methylobacterium bullatum TaxID=570505 RepID=A0A679ISK0_9HYPH|nr:Beta-alanine--pyruvate aminotransferase [Methylobacterium bullatum]